MLARALSCAARRLTRVASVSIGGTQFSCLAFELHPAHEQVAREERRPEAHEQRVDPADDPADAAPGEPARVEPLAPESRVSARLEHAHSVALAMAAQLVRREMADVVRSGRAVQDVRPAPE